eukprot:COSAG02_NODE_56447_length_285_cov_1.118280_1_plen_41_part_10
MTEVRVSIAFCTSTTLVRKNNAYIVQRQSPLLISQQWICAM